MEAIKVLEEQFRKRSPAPATRVEEKLSIVKEVFKERFGVEPDEVFIRNHTIHLRLKDLEFRAIKIHGDPFDIEFVLEWECLKCGEQLEAYIHNIHGFDRIKEFAEAIENHRCIIATIYLKDGDIVKVREGDKWKIDGLWITVDSHNKILKIPATNVEYVEMRRD